MNLICSYRFNWINVLIIFFTLLFHSQIPELWKIKMSRNPFKTLFGFFSKFSDTPPKNRFLVKFVRKIRRHRSVFCHFKPYCSRHFTMCWSVNPGNIFHSIYRADSPTFYIFSIKTIIKLYFVDDFLTETARKSLDFGENVIENIYKKMFFKKEWNSNLDSSCWIIRSLINFDDHLVSIYL